VVKSAVKDANYFHAGGDAPAATIDGVLNDVDALIAKLDAVELADFSTKLAGKKGVEVKPVFVEEAKRVVGAGKAKEGELKTLEG
jgi:DnaJ family protein C protein 2